MTLHRSGRGALRRAHLCCLAVLLALPAAAAAAPVAPATPIPVHGCPLGDYYVRGSVGGQNFHLLLDSGSTTLAVAAPDCDGCGPVHPTYRPGASARDERQPAESMYGDGSGWLGEVYSDLVALPGMAAPVRMRLGSMRRAKNFFTDDPCGPTQAPQPSPYQGILGMGPASLAVPHTDGLVTTLARQPQPLRHFSTALCDEGGHLWLGAFEPRLGQGRAVVAPLEASSPFWAIGLTQLQVGGTSLGFDAAELGAAVVDTGTSELVLPQDAADALARTVEADPVFQAEIGNGAGGWFKQGDCNSAQSLSRHELDARLPPMTLVVTGADGQPQPLQLAATRSYLVPLRKDGVTVYCPGVVPGPEVILGAAVLRSHIVTFAPGTGGAQQGGAVHFTPHRLCGAQQG